jgi:hypothetical protein
MNGLRPAHAGSGGESCSRNWGAHSTCLDWIRDMNTRRRTEDPKRENKNFLCALALSSVKENSRPRFGWSTEIRLERRNTKTR